jgi:hypothetical protein
MRRIRSRIKALFCLSLFILFLACVMAIQAGAQPAAETSSKNTGMMPLSFILDSSLDVHEQDIKENIFEYRFEAAKNDPSLQSSLVKKRSADLKNDAVDKKNMLKALMEDKGEFSDDQMAMLAEEMNSSIEKLNGWSRKLEEHAAGLTLLNGKNAYIESIVPLMGDISDAKELAIKMSQEAKDKKNGSANKK